MIKHAIPFGSAGEALRFSVRGFLRASVKISADDGSTGAVEIRRGYTHRHTAAYTVPQIADITGEGPTDLIVDDCPELVVWVTTAGAGTFDVEWTLDNPVDDLVEDFFASLGGGADIQHLGHDAGDFDRVTVFAVRDGSNTKGVVQLRGSLDPDGIATDLGDIDLDGIPTTFDINPRSRLDLFVSTKNAGLSADFIVYRSPGAVQAGLAIDANVALLDAANDFTAINTFAARTEFDANLLIHDQRKVRLYDSISSDYIGLKAPTTLGVFDGGFDYTIPIKPAGSAHQLRVTAAGLCTWEETEGSTFPTSPRDGQAYFRTDFDNPELFHWDATRAKWLGELVTFIGGYAATIAAGASGTLRMGGHVVPSSSRGINITNDMTIIGCTMFNAVTTSMTIDWIEGSGSVGTLLTVVSDRDGADMSLDVDTDADPGWPHKYAKLFCTLGAPASLNNPIVQIFMRRRET